MNNEVGVDHQPDKRSIAILKLTTKTCPQDKSGNQVFPQGQKWCEAENHPCDKN